MVPYSRLIHSCTVLWSYFAASSGYFQTSLEGNSSQIFLILMIKALVSSDPKSPRGG